MNNNEGSRSKVEIPAAFALFIAAEKKLHCGRKRIALQFSRHSFSGARGEIAEIVGKSF